jgi:tRNA pseudouridine55 synthase
LLLPVDVTIDDLPHVTVDAESAFYLKRGQYVWKSGFNQHGAFRIYAETGEFLGIGEQTAEGKIAPRRLIVDNT